jgi:hypothetical protein
MIAPVVARCGTTAERRRPLYFRRMKLEPVEADALRNWQLVILRCNADLHAKCYAGDQKTGITSMNL